MNPVASWPASIFSDDDTASPAETLLRQNPGMFKPWTDPASGVTSYILTKRVAPFQQSFYYVNPSLSDDGRYFWFYCAFPPAGSANQGRSLGVADLKTGTVHHYPETEFTDASPVVDTATGTAYWCTGLEVWKRRPEPGAQAKLVNRFPAALARNRRPWRLATHLTFSADRKALNLDVEIGTEWFIGHLPLDGGPFELWQRLERCYNHAQFNPVDPSLQLIAQDHSVHPVSGEVTPYENRIWLIRRGEAAAPLFPSPQAIPPHVAGGNPHFETQTHYTITDERAKQGHEWWGSDGQHVWYIAYGQGVKRVKPISKGDPKAELIWPHPSISHAHANSLETQLVCDSLPPDDPSDRRVSFFDLPTRKQINIVSHMPELNNDLRRYHVHPHPQFCLQDRLICYTTTVLDRVDVAFTPLSALRSALLRA
ncbi:MAG TPA: hypothetical protein VIO38_12160 [Rariglobus sp.]